MDITTNRPAADVEVLALTGELDASNFERVIDAARAAHDGGAKTLVIDLSGLSYMGSSGLVAIHSAALIMRGEQPPSPEDGWDAFHRLGHAVDAGPDQRVLLVAPSPAVDRVLERTGLKRLFGIHPDVDTAVAAATAG
jgi:anti-anti-sigma regulatory factor